MQRRWPKFIFGAPDEDGGSENDSEQECKWEPAVLEVGMIEAGFSNKNLGIGGAIIASVWLTHKENGALSVLSLKSNNLHADGGKALAEGLKGNSVITELDIPSNYLGVDSDYEPDMSGVIALADAIPDMRALLSANLLGNDTLFVANVMGNRIGKEQLTKLQEIMRSKPNLVSLCGIADAATGADLSGLGMDAGDAAILASELPDKGALSVLSVESNRFFAEGDKALAEALKGNQAIKELNIASNFLAFSSSGPPGADIPLELICPGLPPLLVSSPIWGHYQHFL
jgi:Ran GTPase-activating protein (RanGAP) involved in mRNA processing and transport